jgi:ABC-type sugar transport system permease subunit
MTRRSARPLLVLLFLAPAVIILVILRVVPAAQAILASFTRWDGFNDPEPVGLANFAQLAGDSTFLRSMQNILVIAITLPLWVMAPILIASLLHDKPFGWRVIRVIMFLPAALSPVVVSVAFDLFLRPDGPLNTFLRAVGAGQLARPWLADPTLVMPVLIGILIWGSLGVGVMVFVAALAQVDPDLVDAARVDGASWWERQVHVHIPSIRPTIEFYSVVTVIGILTGVFAYVFTLTGGGPGFSTYVPEYYLYESAFKRGQFGYSSAIGVVLFLILVVLVTYLLRTFREKR